MHGEWLRAKCTYKTKEELVTDAYLLKSRSENMNAQITLVKSGVSVLTDRLDVLKEINHLVLWHLTSNKMMFPLGNCI